ncbi:MAG: hypothetical protein FJ217_07490 [Ignavibacteria bacterium]|nr:hypothetical protein [Ignavibacteria bacterium]
MVIRPETSRFISELEQHANRKLNHPYEVAELLDAARESDNIRLFEDAIFHAKFITKSFGVMQRIGADGEGYDKLSAEFQLSLDKAATLIRQIAETMSEGRRQHHRALFFSLDQESLSRFMEFLDDLSLVKNWRVDGNPLP